MKSIKVGGIQLAIAAIGLIVAALAYADAQSSLAGQASLRSSHGASVESTRVGDVEDAIARTNVAAQMEDALGADFGGVWFEPSTAQLHVGVTSPASRRNAEAVAVRTGLSSVIAKTPVSSTWPQLAAAQERWGRRLADLFQHGLVKTWISAQDNAVGVELASTVPLATRAKLEREASADKVEVEISVASDRTLMGESQARCAKFVSGKGYCDPTVVGGVSIKSAGGTTCTAGPAVKRKEPSKILWVTDTYILTAGHCLQGGTASEEWTTWNKGGTQSKLGNAVEYKHGDKDVGLISVAKPTWATEEFIPVVPRVAEWNTAAESEPLAVVGETEPVENAKVCVSGHVTGFKCGKVAAKSVNVKFEGTAVTTTELVEVTGVTTQKGDSGSPWMAGEEVEVGLALGTHVGITGSNPLFQTLANSFAALSTKVELVTEVNEERHPFKFEADSSPVVLTGKRTGAAKHVLTTDAATISCNEVSFSKELTSMPVGSFEVEPKFSECTAPMGKNVTVDVNGCGLKFLPFALEGENYEGKVSLICPINKRMEFTVLEHCNIVFGTQIEGGTVTYTNVGSGATREIKVDFNLGQMVYEEHNLAPNNSCAATTKLKLNGKYTGEELITGESKAGAHIGILVTPIG